MNKKKYLVSLVGLWLTCVGGLCAQTLQGKVLTEDGQPLEYANVALVSESDSTAFAGCATLVDGTWTMESAGHEGGLLRVSMVGFQTQYFKPPFPLTVILKENGAAMQEVQVASARKYVKANPRGFTIQMEGNPLAQLPTSLDAIREMPLIEGMGADISVLGRGKPTFYIEHRKVQDIAELQQLKPSEIKSVEILAKPGLKYEKETDAVIIIHLKRRNPGLAGYVSGTGSVAETLSGYAYTKLSYTFHDGLSLYADANGNSNGYRVKTAYSDRYAPENVSSDTHGTSKARNKNLNVNVGGSKDFKKGHSVGARYSYTRTPSSLLMSDAYNLSTNSMATQKLSTSTRTSKQSWRHYANAYTSLQLSKPLTLTADADYLWGKAPSRTGIVERTQGEEPWLMNTSNLKDYKMAAAKADLEGSWNNWSLQTGVNYSFTKNGLAFDSQASDGNTLFQSADDSERQNLYAVYGTAAWQVNEHWALSAGLRCELTDFDYKQDNEEVAGQSKNYVDWLPEVGVSYMYKDLILGLTYDSKAYRPTYSDLNNNYTYITHTSWTTGNPLLKSNIIRNLEASLSWKQTYVSLVYCRRFRNFQTIYRYLPEQQVNLRQNINLPGFNDFRLEASQSFDVKWWHPSLQGTLMLEDLEYGEEGWRKSYKKPYFLLTTKNRFDLPWKIYVWVGATWTGRGNVTTVYYDHHNFTAYLQMSKSIRNWDLSLAVNDFTHTNRMHYRIDTNGVRYKAYEKGSSCLLQLSATYSFNYKNKKEYRGKGASGDELQRLD